MTIEESLRQAERALWKHLGRSAVPDEIAERPVMTLSETWQRLDEAMTKLGIEPKIADTALSKEDLAAVIADVEVRLAATARRLERQSEDSAGL